MRELHLFAGIGGGILGGLLCGHTCVCAVEIEPFCRNILIQRQRDGILPRFPIWDDVDTFDARPWRGMVDILCAGFPCQAFSVEGRRDWETSKRNLWPATRSIISDLRLSTREHLFKGVAMSNTTKKLSGCVAQDIFAGVLR